MTNKIITDALREKRPNLKDSSISTYGTLLKTLHQEVYGDSEPIDLDNFRNVDKIQTFFEGRTPTASKTTLSALVVLTDDDDYRTMMMEQIKAHTNTINKQEKSDKQEAAWVSSDVIHNKFQDMIKPVDALFKKAKNEPLSLTDLQRVQQLVILAVIGGIFIPPRRAMDYTQMINPTFKDYTTDKDDDNFVSGSNLVFNKYKTSKYYGTQTVKMDKKLKGIITRWAKVNPYKWLFFAADGKQLNSITFGQRINKMFGNKNIGVNGMRHTYLTDKFGDMSKKQRELDADMTDMGSSTKQSKTYIKLD